MNATLLPFFLILISGYVCRFIPGIPNSSELRRSLNTVVMWFLLPALLFQIMSQVSPDRMFFVVPLIALLTLFFNLAFAWFVFQIVFKFFRLKLSGPAIGALLLTAAWGNITFLGLPLLTAFFGPPAGHIAVLYDVFAVGPAIYILGPVIAGFYSEESRKSFSRSLKNGLKVFLRLPPVWSVFCAILFHISGIVLSPHVTASLDLMSRGVTPLMLFSVGLALELPKTKKEFLFMAAVLAAAIIKLGFSPLSTFFLIEVASYVFGPTFELSHLQLGSLILEGAMPSMVATLIIAEAGGLDIKITAQTITLTTILSLITIPIVRALV